MSIQQLSTLYQQGKLTSVQMVTHALHMIATHDQGAQKLNSVCEVHPDALFMARALDAEAKTTGVRSALHGIPFLVKDNIDVAGLHTTAGSAALHDLIATTNAPIVQKLIDAGAVIIGKTNLSEFAYWMSTKDMPSGYSSLHGQVVHAYQQGYDPSGSSSGSGVATSARLVPFTIGSETDGSLNSPAIHNAIVTIKPTIGVVSRTGILPLSHIQDTAGPMTTSVEDAALVLSIIAGKEEHDASTHVYQPVNYLDALKQGINGMRVGIVHLQGHEETPQEQQAYEQLEAILRAQNAQISTCELDEYTLDETELLKHEFHHDIDVYLASHQSVCRSLEDIVQYNLTHASQCLRYGQDLLIDSLSTSGELKESAYIEERLRLSTHAQKLIDDALEKTNAEVLVFPTNATNMNLAPVCGYPCMSIPAIVPDEHHFAPMSYYMIAPAFQEATLFRLAKGLQDALGIEPCPSWVDRSIW